MLELSREIGIDRGELADLGLVLGMFTLLALGVIFVSLIIYVLEAFALMKISNNVGFDKGWLAWVPIANSFVMPMMVENEVHKSMRGKFTLIYGIALGASVLLSGFIPFISLVPTVLSYYAFYLIAKWFSENPIIHVVIAVVTLGLSLPISLLMFRNRKKLTEQPEIIEQS